MKLNLSFILFLLFLASINSSCKKQNQEDNQDEPQVHSGQVGGAIILPSGFNSDLSGWKINSSFSETEPTGNSYEATVSKDQVDIQFVTDSEGKEVLMGITYPGQTDFSISPASSVLAILLKAPAVASLTIQGQLDLIAAIKANPKFESAVEAVSNTIQGGNALLDTSNAAMFQKLGELFETAAMKTTAGNETVTIMSAGKELLFQNPGKPFVQVIGIYKDEARIKKLTLDRYQYFAGSIPELITGAFNPPNPIEQPFTLPGDGQYEIRVRTGHKGTDVESNEAAVENMVNMVLDNLAHFLKFIDFNKKAGCLGSIMSWTYDEVTAIKSTIPDNTNAATFSGIMVQVTSSVTNLIETTHTDCFKKPSPTFFGKLVKLFKVFEPVSKIASGINQSAFLYQYFASPAAYDTCLQVTGNTIGACNKIQLLAKSIVKTGVHPDVTCASDTFKAYTLSFTYDDPFNLISPDLANIEVKWEHGGPSGMCVAAWSLSSANDYFKDYPVTFLPSQKLISIPIFCTFHQTEWIKAVVYFTDPVTKLRISNKIEFSPYK